MRKQHQKLLRGLAREHGPNLSGLIIACTHLVLKRQDFILQNQEAIMSKLDEIKAENGLLKSSVLTLINQDDANTQSLRDLIGKRGGATDEELQSLIDDSQATRATIAQALGRDTLADAVPLGSTPNPTTPTPPDGLPPGSA